MSAQAFDPDEIARRVFDAEQAAIDEPRNLPPLARAEGMTVTGGGDGRGRPVPTEAIGTAEDIFDRLERQRADKAIRSPFGDHPVVHFVADVEADLDRFVTPDLDDEDIPADMPAPEIASPQVSASNEVEKCATPHDPRCGQPLTGGGAPRGWVLVRIIGQGQPRRYCSPACAITALDHPQSPAPGRRQQLVGRGSGPTEATTPAGPAGPRPRRRPPVPSTIDQAEVVRRYQDGETPPQIGRALGHTAGTIRKALDRAGVERRDDRATASGSQPKHYDPQLVARVRALYTLHKLTQAEVAEAIGSSTKVVQNIMARHGIEARPAASVVGHPGTKADRAKPLKQLMTESGITSAQVRAWARGAGYLVPDVGLVSASLVDSYLAAHQNGAST